MLFATRGTGAGLRSLRIGAGILSQRIGMSTVAKDGASSGKKRMPRLQKLKRAAYGTALVGATYMGWLMYQNRNPSEQLPFDPSKKTLVLLGTGWGSTTALKNIDTDNFNVVVVSPRNYFLFTPLLPSCTVGTIENRSIMEPVRFLTRHKHREVRFYEAECTDLNARTKELTLTRKTSDEGGADQHDTFKLKYDYLVVGVGGTVNTFGTPGVEEHACFLKEMGDARKIRRKLMDCIESATIADVSEAERDRLLHM
ncbi:NADH:ubiquinone oxidoreductase, partial [Coemansia sp. RSA 1939]